MMLLYSANAVCCFYVTSLLGSATVMDVDAAAADDNEDDNEDMMN